MLTSRLALILGLGLTASTASAATYDGAYSLEHQSVRGSVEVCLDYGDVEGCVPVALELILEEGQVGLGSLETLMDDVLSDLEDTRGRALHPRVEAGLYSALERLYVEVEEELGAALMALPQEMTVTQTSMDERVIKADLQSGYGDVWVLPGQVNPSTGAFELMGSMSGQFESLSASKGKGKMGLNVDVEAQEAGLTLTVSGEGAVEFGLF